jgi:hypothetical protein
MANQRKSKSRKSWVAVAQRLSGEVRRKASPFRSGAGHKVAVESGKPRRLGRVGSVGENLLDFMLRAEKISGYDKEYQISSDKKMEI